MNKVLDYIKRILIYLIGLLIIATGINISKMAGLGISPVSSIPRALEVTLNFTLGQMVIIVYCLLVIAQIIVLRKEFKLLNILGVPVALVFGWMVDLMGIDPNAFGHLLYNFPRPSNYIMSFLYLIVSIIIIAIGVYIYLMPNLIPMPAEGLAQAISIKSGKAFGDCKTFVDTGLILVALILQLIFLDGFNSFTNPNVIVREGTIISAVCVGQLVKLIKKAVIKIKQNKEANGETDEKNWKL